MLYIIGFIFIINEEIFTGTKVITMHLPPTDGCHGYDGAPSPSEIPRPQWPRPRGVNVATPATLPGEPQAERSRYGRSEWRRCPRGGRGDRRRDHGVGDDPQPGCRWPGHEGYGTGRRRWTGPLADAGAVVAASARDAVQDAGVVITMLPTADVVDSVIFDGGVADAFTDGCVWLRWARSALRRPCG